MIQFCHFQLFHPLIIFSTIFDTLLHTLKYTHSHTHIDTQPHRKGYLYTKAQFYTLYSKICDNLSILYNRRTSQCWHFHTVKHSVLWRIVKFCSHKAICSTRSACITADSQHFFFYFFVFFLSCVFSTHSHYLLKTIILLFAQPNNFELHPERICIKRLCGSFYLEVKLSLLFPNSEQPYH